MGQLGRVILEVPIFDIILSDVAKKGTDIETAL